MILMRSYTSSDWSLYAETQACVELAMPDRSPHPKKSETPQKKCKGQAVWLEYMCSLSHAFHIPNRPKNSITNADKSNG